MNSHSTYFPIGILVLSALLVAAIPNQSDAQSAAGSMVKLLDSGRIPPERQGSIIGLIATRGDATDLGYLFQQSVAAEGTEKAFNAENRVAALAALANATRTRKVVPEGDLTKLKSLFQADTASQLAAIELVGLWKVEALANDLKQLLGTDSATDAVKAHAIDALTSLGPDHARSAIDAMLAPDSSLPTRYRGVAALAAIDLDAAAKHAAIAIKEASEEHQPTEMILALLEHNSGADTLAAAIKQNPPNVDGAKFALRSIYGAGRSDPALVTVLNEIAGIEQGPVKLSEEEVAKLVAKVKSHGDPIRGETIFRRNDLNCFKCHALSKAGGQIGPDLSAVGKTSPPDYVIRSLLDPDESIKEAFQTLAVQTFDGKTYFGILADESDDQIVLREANGKEIVVPVDDIAAEKKGASLMPKGLTGFLTDQEFLDLVSFVAELGKPGPYQIRDTLSMQRWRLLTNPDESLTQGVPDASTFTSNVLSATDGQWRSLYANVDGFVPLAEAKDYATGTPIYLQGEIEITHAGTVGIEIEHAEGVNVWIADRDFGSSAKVAVGLPEGKQTITLRIDPTARDADRLRVNFVPVEDAAASFTVVGGA